MPTQIVGISNHNINFKNYSWY